MYTVRARDEDSDVNAEITFSVSGDEDRYSIDNMGVLTLEVILISIFSLPTYAPPPFLGAWSCTWSKVNDSTYM